MKTYHFALPMVLLALWACSTTDSQSQKALPAAEVFAPQSARPKKSEPKPAAQTATKQLAEASQDSVHHQGHHHQVPTTAAPWQGRAQQAHKIPPPKRSEGPDPKLAAMAEKLLAQGIVHYRKGEYAEAEEVLKEAITMHPFMAEANLILGKILLIRGSANRDRATINSARLMFEMARAIDPTLREPAMLLELFQDSPPE